MSQQVITERPRDLGRRDIILCATVQVVDRGNRRKTQENITIDISNIHGIVLFYYLRNNRQDLFIYIITRTTNDNANQFLNSANACFVNISRCLLSLEIILFHILT